MIYGSPPGQCHLNGGRQPLSWRNLWEGLYFFPGMGQSPQFHAYLLYELQHSQQNAPKRDIFGKYFLILVDNAPNRGYNEITIKQGTKQITRNGA